MALSTISTLRVHLRCIPRISSCYQRYFYSTSHVKAEDKSAQPDTPPTSLPPEAEAWKAEKSSLLEKIAEYDDKYKRSLAEMENLRTRMNRQVEEAKLFGITSFCKDLLDVADVLTKATTTVSEEEVQNQGPQLKQMYEGLCMTEKQMLTVLEKHGVKRVSPAPGSKFDPNYHEALYNVPVAQAAKEPPHDPLPGTVAVLTKVGYQLRERPLRPALVAVYKK